MQWWVAPFVMDYLLLGFFFFETESQVDQTDSADSLVSFFYVMAFRHSSITSELCLIS